MDLEDFTDALFPVNMTWLSDGLFCWLVGCSFIGPLSAKGLGAALAEINNSYS